MRRVRDDGMEDIVREEAPARPVHDDRCKVQKTVRKPKWVVNRLPVVQRPIQTA